MNDKELKKFLRENSKVPRHPTNEWSQILIKIDSSKGESSLMNKNWPRKLGLGISSFAALMIVVLSISHQIDKRLSRLKQVDNFLTADSYFSESESQYSWIEDL